MKELYSILASTSGMEPECAGALVEGYAAITGNPMVESIFTNFGSKVAKGIVTAAMMMGLLTSGASAATKRGAPAIHKGKAVPSAVVSKKTTRKGVVTKTVTKGDLRNVYASDAYNQRVYEILLQMTQQNPGVDEQRMYDKACAQALEEVMEGKLKL